MKLSVEISKYPLAEDYIGPIKGFIEQLNQYPDIRVITNTMSTQLFGDYDDVMQALQDCIKASFAQYGKVVFVCKFIHGDLQP
ncbi:YkoF family thiamine/hydroxymethylpyrimidine-binding protein [Arsukibacterium sp.]|uniref:YkoF family thiamine/hydroxymethylpyrimidine-binding protein n=1 Tax=Arsukibacterium sp. TaxID=1977258 RepID=UPI00299DE918|nr:YkoF family thiamine/hydroxymethylpyrimidine-binding protein [Arsukibacterium sp.]MDX1678022.1 YkoF family thiamine/hydroxymethylpyrimidine-binding protein [Arsukibacterium sp.]